MLMLELWSNRNERVNKWQESNCFHVILFNKMYIFTFKLIISWYHQIISLSNKITWYSISIDIFILLSNNNSDRIWKCLSYLVIYFKKNTFGNGIPSALHLQGAEKDRNSIKDWSLEAKNILTIPASCEIGGKLFCNLPFICAKMIIYSSNQL